MALREACEELIVEADKTKKFQLICMLRTSGPQLNVSLGHIKLKPELISTHPYNTNFAVISSKPI